MSNANVHALRELYGEWAKGNFGTGAELFAPDVVLESFAERSSLRGIEAIQSYMRGFLEQWSAYRIEAEEFTEAGDSVVVTERQYATGSLSGIETVATFYAVWTFQRGRVVHARWEDDRATAFGAVGLLE